MAELTPVARALARIPSGLFILSLGRGDVRTAMLVSFVQQVGFAPPTVCFALKKGRDHVLDLLRAERAFCIAVVPDGHKALLGQFAAGFAPGVDPFAGVVIKRSSHGVPFPADACAHLACELAGEADWTDHLLIGGRVIDGDVHGDAKPWLHVRKNGLGY
jgi:3-hydroxy-9,10-secoandrosta-1,3,5(10)-triene-9,17-dione monooxygenase reductase component